MIGTALIALAVTALPPQPDTAPKWMPRLRFGFTSRELDVPVYQATIGVTRPLGKRLLLDFEVGAYRFPGADWAPTVGASVIINLGR